MLERIEDELRNLGTRRGASDVVAKGNTLTVRFKRAAPDFPALTTLPFFCAVPPTLPVDPEGIGVIPSAGPNRVTEYRPGERVALRRNRPCSSILRSGSWRSTGSTSRASSSSPVSRFGCSRSTRPDRSSGTTLACALPGNPDPGPTYNLKAFTPGGEYSATSTWCEADLYAGQPCNGGDPYVFRPLIGYHECLNFVDNGG
jgi:hypothetical protein